MLGGRTDGVTDGFAGCCANLSTAATRRRDANDKVKVIVGVAAEAEAEAASFALSNSN